MAMARGGQTLLSAAARHWHSQAPCSTRRCRFAATVTTGSRASTSRSRSSSSAIAAHCSFTPPADADKSYRVVRGGDLWQPVREIRAPPAGRTRRLRRPRRRPARDRAPASTPAARLSRCSARAAPARRASRSATAAAWLGDWPGGVWFCDLSEASSLDGIHYAVGSALGVRLGAGDAAAQLAEAIAGRGRCLVVLDNFEQIVEHAAATVGRWLDGAPEAAFLVTSRERLNLAGEVVQPVEPLPLDGPAIELFVVRARAQRPDFALDDAQPRRRRRGRAPARRPAAGDRARGGARRACCRRRSCCVRLRDRFQLLAGARGAAPPGDAARGDRLVVAAAQRRGSRPRSSSARCSKAASRSPPPKRCSISRPGPTRRRSSMPCRRSSTRACCGAGCRAGAAAPRTRRAVLRHVPQHPRVRDREAAPAWRRRRTSRCSSATAAASRPSAPTTRSRRSPRHGGMQRQHALRHELDNLSPPAGARWRGATVKSLSPATAQPGRCWRCRGRSASR